MRRLRRIGLVMLVLAFVVMAWEPTRVAIQTAVMLPNLLDAGPQPLNLFSEAPGRASVPYRTPEPGADPDLAELWLPSWASALTSSCSSAASSSLRSTNTWLRDSKAPFSSKDGFSVVAPTRVTMPSSTKGRKPSCWARLKR